MKFFTAAWIQGELSDEEAEAVAPAYWAYLATLAERMPATVYTLAHGVNIHDGRIRAVVFDRHRATLTLSMRCGDLQAGYFDLDLVYSDVVLTDGTVSILRELARTADAEALYDEVDIGDAQSWLHRILFWPDREIAVTFGRLALRLEPVPEREFDRPPDVYTEIPD
jgi:hypothetical protein